MLLTALVLSDDDTLLAAFRGSKVLQRVELSLHSCKVFAAQDIVWRSALRGVNDLQQALTSMRPIPPHRPDVKVLILGVSESGKTTILKVRFTGLRARTRHLTCGAITCSKCGSSTAAHSRQTRSRTTAISSSKLSRTG
jgi:hypothetical protein